MSDHDWGLSDWDEIVPEPPNEESDPGGTYSAGSGESEDNALTVPLPKSDPSGDSWEISLGISEEVYDVWEFITNPDNINPANLRGVGFIDPEEAITWLYELGLLGFSEIIEIDDLWFPVIGDSDEASAG